MKHNRGVGVGLVITKGQEVLLMKRKGAHGEGTWSPPGGYLEMGESFEECARREAEEEVAVQVAKIKFRAVTNDIFPEEKKHFVTIWMEGEYKEGTPCLNAPREVAEVGWFSWDNLPQPLFLPFHNLVVGNCYSKQGKG